MKNSAYLLGLIALCSLLAFSEKSLGAASVVDASQSLRQNNSYSLSLRFNLQSEKTVSFAYHLSPDKLVEGQYFRKETVLGKRSLTSADEVLSLGYRQFWANSFNVSVALGFKEFKAELFDANNNFAVDIFRQDIVLRMGLGNRWEIDDLLWVGVEWCAGQVSLNRVENAIVMRSSKSIQSGAILANEKTLRTLSKNQSLSGSVLNLELGLSF